MEFPFNLPLILDGDYKTNLIEGLDIEDKFEKLILNNPKSFFDLQAEFIKNGSQAVSTPTYFCNEVKLEKYGLKDKVYDINFNLAKQSKEIASDNALVYGVISKTGLKIQPFGETTFTDLIDIYYNQALALSKGGVDFLFIYDMDNLMEIRAAIFACKKIEIPIFLTVNIKEQDIDIKKETIISYLISTQDLGISAFGINGDIEIQQIENVVNDIKQYSKIPIIFKPNSGKQNPVLTKLYDLSPKHFVELMDKLLIFGICIIGGDLGANIKHINELNKNFSNKNLKNILLDLNCKNQNENLVLSNENQVFNLKYDILDFSKPIKCSLDMSDKFLQIEGQPEDIITIELVSPEDGMLFGLNQHMTKLPICFLSDNEIALKTALMLFNGKALIDKNSSIENQILINICNKYGSVLY